MREITKDEAALVVGGGIIGETAADWGAIGSVAGYIGESTLTGAARGGFVGASLGTAYATGYVVGSALYDWAHDS